MERLQKYMSRCGVASRRRCEELIMAGRVRVNKSTVKEPGCRVNPDRDRVEVDGKPIGVEKRKIYIMLNKPAGYISTAEDQFGRPTVLDLVKGVRERVYPVGRLDYNTEGLILLTNDGDFAYSITHPSSEIEKVYMALVSGTPTAQELERLSNGMEIEDYVTSPARVRLLRREGDRALISLTLHEGRNRQVRKMCEAIGHPVIWLKRVAIGGLELGNLERGRWRHLTAEEVGHLRR